MRWGGGSSACKDNLAHMNGWLRDRVGFLDSNLTSMK